MLGEKPVKVPDPDDPTKKIMDYWPTSQVGKDSTGVRVTQVG